VYRAVGWSFGASGLVALIVRSYERSLATIHCVRVAL
jgi:hypothetical protein